MNRLQPLVRNFSPPQWLLRGAVGTEAGQTLSCPPLAASTPVSAQHSALLLSCRLETAPISGLQSSPLGMEAAPGEKSWESACRGRGNRDQSWQLLTWILISKIPILIPLPCKIHNYYHTLEWQWSHWLIRVCKAVKWCGKDHTCKVWGNIILPSVKGLLMAVKK